MSNQKTLSVSPVRVKSMDYIAKGKFPLSALPNPFGPRRQSQALIYHCVTPHTFRKERVSMSENVLHVNVDVSRNQTHISAVGLAVCRDQDGRDVVVEFTENFANRTSPESIGKMLWDLASSYCCLLSTITYASIPLDLDTQIGCNIFLTVDVTNDRRRSAAKLVERLAADYPAMGELSEEQFAAMFTHRTKNGMPAFQPLSCSQGFMWIW